MFDSTPKSLRPHQERSIGLLRQSLSNGKRRPILQLPTGAGKTVVAASIIRMALEKGNRATFVVPAVSLIDQTVNSFMSEGIREIGVIQGDHPMQDWSKPVQVASIQTIARRCFPESDLVIVDEAHQQFKAISRWMETCAETPFVGLTATPWARGLGKNWDDLIIGSSIRELIDAGYLSDFEAYAAPHPDLAGIKITAGDYNKAALGEVMNESRVVGDVVDTWLRLGEGQPTLVFAVNCAHATALQASFQSRGVGAGYIDAWTERDERAAIERQMERGEISVVCNVGCLTTGVDWDVRCVVLARPTKSEMLFVQMVGRGLRTAEGKDRCIILDHGDNHARMGFVTDIHHEKLNDGTKPENVREASDPLPKECGKCGFMKAPKVHECPSCGFKPEAQPNVEHEGGELVAITKKKEATKEAKQAFYSGLLRVRKDRGRSTGWVSHTYRDKFGVWPEGLAEVDMEPSPEVKSFVRHKDIKFAKSRARA